MISTFAFMLLVASSVNCDYNERRAALISKEKQMRIGSSVVLSEKEKVLNGVLMEAKLKEYDEGFEDPAKFLAAQHFFNAKPLIEKSDVFKFLQKLPKGGMLHGHDSSLVSLDYLYDLTYADDLYGCVVDDRLRLRFLQQSTYIDCEWRLISELRSENDAFDDFLQTQISITKYDPDVDFEDINVVWDTFQKTFATVEGMIFYAPVYKKYVYQVLKELYQDNVMYLEMRATLSPLYDFDGTVYDEMKVVEVYNEAISSFLEDYPEYIGVRIIYAPHRGVNITTIDSYLDTFKKIKEAYPQLIAGFDLVGQEDLGEPLIQFIESLKELNADVFYHAGETNWYGSSTDSNLIDAVLLHTKRIGHGYATTKHPKVLKEIKNKSIAIEVSPLSNQILKLVKDLRNHPATIFVANNYPMVVCSDNPGYWGAKALSYDWYVAFMSFASRDADLTLLKQWSLNSISFSSLSREVLPKALKTWEDQWDRYVNEVSSLINEGSSYL